MKQFKDKYVKIQLPKKLDKLGLTYLEPEYFYCKIGEVHDQWDTASFAVEILDYVGDRGQLSKTFINLEDRFIALISYMTSQKVQEISENEFYDALRAAMAAVAPKLKTEDAITVPFMIYHKTERIEFLKLLRSI